MRSSRWDCCRLLISIPPFDLPVFLSKDRAARMILAVAAVLSVAAAKACGRHDAAYSNRRRTTDCREAESKVVQKVLSRSDAVDDLGNGFLFCRPARQCPTMVQSPQMSMP